MPLSLGLLLRCLVYENVPLGPTVVVTPYRELTLPRKVTMRPAGYSSTTLPEKVQRLPASLEAKKLVMTGATLLTVTWATLDRPSAVWAEAWPRLWATRVAL